jgi:hypothetical protein
MWMKATASCCVLISTLLGLTAEAQFKVVGNFTLNPANPSTGLDDSGISAYLAQQAVATAAHQLAMVGLGGIQEVDRRYIVPIRNLEGQLSLADHNSDSAAAKVIARQLQTAWNQLQGVKDLKVVRDFNGIRVFLHDSGLDGVNNSFTSYVNQVGQSVHDAQAVSAQIDAYIKSNQSGLDLLQAAWQNEGTNYDQMVCSDLIVDAVGTLGYTVPSYQPLLCSKCSATAGWFRYGMGPLYPQILGGDSGVSIRQLVDDYMAGKVAIPIGSLLVADGHVALFEGTAKVGGQTEFITYDANATKKGWTVSVVTGAAHAGDASHSDLGVVQLSFGAHQVGEHVTHFDWQDDTVVKVFKFIGNSAIHEESYTEAIEKAKQVQCRQDVGTAMTARTTACSPGHPQSGCDAARMRVDQATFGCSVPLSESQ